MATKHKFVCHGCGRKFPHRPGADLFCSPRCEAADKKLHAAIAAKLKQQGFTQHKEAANLFMKDGVGVTTHEIKAHGFKETLAKHREVVAAIKQST